MEETKQKEQQQEETQKITIEMAEYENLRTENVKLRANMQQAMMQMEQMNNVIVEKRLSFLFKVIENAIRFDDAFVAYCTNEIQESLWVKEEENKKDEQC